jgi:PIN domain nuclease of toxin-antitoxin system
VRFLLDTHALLWWIADAPQLSAGARRLIEAADHEILVSAVSGWEISVKYQLGKLQLARPPEQLIPHHVDKNGFVVLPVSLAHALQVRRLPLHHRDPFDACRFPKASWRGCRSSHGTQRSPRISLTCAGSPSLLSASRSDREGADQRPPLPGDAARDVIRALVPNAFPPVPPVAWNPQLREQFDGALLALGRLDSVSTLLPDASLFLSMYVRREAVLPSMMEGTQSSLADLQLFELEEERGMSSSAVKTGTAYATSPEITRNLCRRSQRFMHHLGACSCPSARYTLICFACALYVWRGVEGPDAMAGWIESLLGSSDGSL